MTRPQFDPPSAYDRLADRFGMAWAAPFLLVLVVSVTACSTRRAQNAAQSALTVLAHGVVVTDEQAATEYEDAAARALDAAESLAEYRDLMEPYDRLEAGLRHARSALLFSQSMLDAWRAGSDADGWRSAVPCLVIALQDLAALLDSAGVAVPPQLTQAIDIGAAFLSRRCGASE